MNIILKVCLRSVLLSNKPKSRNKQRNSTRLFEWRRKSFFDNAHLNILRAINAKWEGARSSTRIDNKTAQDSGTRAGIARDNLAIRDPKQDDKGIRDLRQETSAKQDNKKAVKLVIGARTGARKLSSCIFFLAVRLFYFLTFSYFKSVIG